MAIAQFLDRVLRLLGIAILAAMMVLTFADVVGREVFARPLSVAPELTVMGLVALVYVGLPRVSATDEHISIGLLQGLFKGRAYALKSGFVCLIMAGISAVLARQIWIHGDKLGAEVMILLDFRKAWLAYAMSVLVGMTAAVFLVRAGARFRSAARHRGT